MTRGSINRDAAHPMFEDWIPGFPFEGSTRDYSQLAELDRKERERSEGEEVSAVDSVAKVFFGGVRDGLRGLVNRMRN